MEAPGRPPGHSSKPACLLPSPTPGRSLLMPFEDRGDLEPLELVWAKCRGYPSYPALVSLPFHSPSPGGFWPLPCLEGLSDWIKPAVCLGVRVPLAAEGREVLSQPGWVTPARLRVLKIGYSMHTEARALRVLIEYIYLLNGKIIIMHKSYMCS